MSIVQGPLLATPKPWRRRVTGAQYDDIVLRFHFEFGGECMLTSNIARQTSNIS
jgi:hypothetical protein